MLNLLSGIAVLFVVMWILGFTLHFMGGLILLLVLAVISVLVRIIMGRRIA